MKTQIQAYIVASILNIKRLMAFFILLFLYTLIIKPVHSHKVNRPYLLKIIGFSTGPIVCKKAKNGAINRCSGKTVLGVFAWECLSISNTWRKNAKNHYYLKPEETHQVQNQVSCQLAIDCMI